MNPDEDDNTPSGWMDTKTGRELTKAEVRLRFAQEEHIKSLRERPKDILGIIGISGVLVWVIWNWDRINAWVLDFLSRP